MSKTVPEKILRKSTKISMSVFLRLCFVLLRFQVLLSDGSSKTLQKTFNKKNRVEKFYKKIDKKPKPIFSRFCMRCDPVTSRLAIPFAEWNSWGYNAARARCPEAVPSLINKSHLMLCSLGQLPL
jgi:hypothetical protein